MSTCPIVPNSVEMPQWCTKLRTYERGTPCVCGRNLTGPLQQQLMFPFERECKHRVFWKRMVDGSLFHFLSDDVNDI